MALYSVVYTWRTLYLLRRLRLLVAAAGLGCAGLAACSWLFAILPPPRSVHSHQNKHGAESFSGLDWLADNLGEPSRSEKGHFRNAAVAVDSIPCAKIGRDVMLRGGNAFDAAIGAMYCNSVVNSQSMGLGGGFIMVMYLANGTRLALNARETAPALAHKHMFRGNESLTHFGPLASGIPGFVAGTWALKQRLGNPAISWSSLIQPAIDLCYTGITVNKHADMFGKKVASSMRRDPGLVDVFIDKRTNTVRNEGEVYTFPLLGDTLTRIARHGGREFYEGLTAQRLVEDIQKAGGIITMQDLADYRVVWDEPITVKLEKKGLTLITSPPPGSGAITAAILGIMDQFNLSPLDLHRSLTWHRFAEASKYGFAQKTHLADWSFPKIRESVRKVVERIVDRNWLQEISAQIADQLVTSPDPGHYGAEYSSTDDHGTCHMNFLGPDGSSAVSVTASINLIYGCKFMSRQTGVVMNNQMDDFASPNIVSAYNLRPSPNNFIGPGKRPMSSISTTIVTDDTGHVIALVGASGGTKIITAVAQVLLRMLYLGQDVKTAVDAPRFHHQLLPMELWHEDGTSRFLLEQLHLMGHNLTQFETGGSAVQAILVDRETGLMTANADFRKGGAVYGF